MVTPEEFDSLEDELASLRAAYAASLPARLTIIEDCWHRLSGSGPGTKADIELAGELHQIAGSAGSFGMAELGEAAARAEELLLDSEDFENRRFLEDFNSALREIEGLIRSR